MNISGAVRIPQKESRMLGYSAIGFNIFTIVFGILYLFAQRHTGIWVLYDILLTVTFGVNIFLVAQTGYKTTSGRRLGLIGNIYLAYIVFAMFGMIYGNVHISNAYGNSFKQDWSHYLLIYLSFFGIFAIGTKIAILSFQGRQEVEPGIDRLQGLIRGYLGQIITYLLMALGLFMAYLLVTGKKFMMLELMISPYAGFFAIIFLSILVFNLCMQKRKKYKYYVTLVMGILVVGGLLLPILATPLSIRTAEMRFAEAFGADWRSKLGDEVVEHFRSAPFSLAAYFLGIPPKEYVFKKDVLFYTGTGVEEGIRLYFDAFFPPQGRDSLPGKGSTIIRIHGGAWVAGDKGIMNMMQQNKYLAAQGYTVFDIQYGLSSTSTFRMKILTPEHVRGDFSVDDMLRHVGIFLEYLADHQDEYQANLDSVFISGGSAGGHLTSAAALGIHTGEFADIFGTAVKIKGLVPFYPANNIAWKGGIVGTPELMNPDLLVVSTSPPALVFQGTHDNLVPHQVSERFKEAYDVANNPKCAVLSMPFGGHASDLNFSGNYMQVFLYYMERFLYLYK